MKKKSASWSMNSLKVSSRFPTSLDPCSLSQTVRLLRTGFDFLRLAIFFIGICRVF